MHSAQMMSQITPLEIDILFHLCDLLHQTGRIMFSDLQSISPEQYMKQITKRLTELHAVSVSNQNTLLIWQSPLGNVGRNPFKSHSCFRVPRTEAC